MAYTAAEKKRIRQAKAASANSRTQLKNPVIDGGFDKTDRTLLGYDWILIGDLVVLLAFGLIMLYSASSYTALIEEGDAAFYAKKQLFAAAAGLVVMIVVSFFPPVFWKVVSPLAYLVGAGLIMLTLTSMGIEVNGATRWLKINEYSIQPSEIMKFAVIIMMAFLLSLLIESIDRPLVFFGLFIVGIIPAGLVIVITDDLGTGIIFFGIVCIMFFVCCGKKRYLAVSVVVLACAAVWFIMSEGYRSKRIYAWLSIEDYASDEGYQVLQGLYAIASGGIFGKGLGKSTQKLSFVPEAENDMIFSIICEELGLIGAFVLILLYAVLLWRMVRIFGKTKDTFSKLVVAGVASHISVQTIVNMCVVTNLLPNTGVPLPFVSYGGTSMLILLAEIGLVLGVSRRSQRQKQPAASAERGGRRRRPEEK